MKNSPRSTLALGALLAGLAAGCRTVPAFDADERRELAESVVSEWSEVSRLAAARTIERYGPPDAIAEGAIGWVRKGPWRRMVIWDSAREEPGRRGRTDNFEQTVSYRVPDGKRDALAAFARGVRVSEDGAELSARSSDEDLNFLALNLADEIARGEIDPDEARGFYDRTTLLAASGKTSPYMQRLLFQPRD